jgi:hypothetical protein
MRSSLPIACLALAAATAAAQSASQQQRAEVLILGTYHMANPGRDVFNMEADDVIAPKRQAQIAELLAVLKHFRPTKVAVESTVWEDTRPRQYADYLVGKRELSRNEIEQIGFRLAKELGHATIYPVDVDGEFPWMRLDKFARATGQSQAMERIRSEIGEMVKRQDAFLKSHTILETLLQMNSDAKVAEDVGFYHREAHLSEPGDWAGPDLLASWYKRNIRIFGNIANLVESPAERVLVVYGAGHLGWLRQAVASDPTMTLRTLADLVEPAPR